MNEESTVKRMARKGIKLLGALVLVAALLTRVVVGHGFYQAGNGKWSNIERTEGFFENLGIPAPAFQARFVATLELVGGIALVLGLATRFFAFMLSSTMVVAIATAHRSEFIEGLGAPGSLLDISAAAYLLMLLWLLFSGPGALSLDRLIAGWLGLNAPAEAEAGTSAKPAAAPQQAVGMAHA